jgi:hypothetical protein
MVAPKRPPCSFRPNGFGVSQLSQSPRYRIPCAGTPIPQQPAGKGRQLSQSITSQLMSTNTLQAARSMSLIDVIVDRLEDVGSSQY